MSVHSETDGMETESSGRASKSNGRVAESVKMPQEFPAVLKIVWENSVHMLHAVYQLLIWRGLGAKHLQFHTALVKKATPKFPFQLGRLSTLFILKLYYELQCCSSRAS